MGYTQNSKNAPKGDPRFYEILETLADIHSKKSQGYSPGADPLANLRVCEQIKFQCPHCDRLVPIPAWVGVAIRRLDKWARQLSLIQGTPDEVNESLSDTLIDDAVYALLEKILIDEQTKRG
jgi:hypothetical protein